MTTLTQLQEKAKERLQEIVSTPYLTTDRKRKYIEDLLLSQIEQAYEAGEKAGRTAMLEEWMEEKKKFIMGFSYRTKKK